MNMLRGSPQEWKKKNVLFTELKGPSGFRLQYERHSKQAGFDPDVSSDSHGLLIQPTLPIGVHLRHVPDETRVEGWIDQRKACLLYTSPSPRDATLSRMPSSA